jgi:hypothetical protein
MCDFQRHVNVILAPQEQRHVGERRADRDVLEISFNRAPRLVGRKRQRLIRGQVVRLIAPPQALDDGTVHPIRVMTTRRE